MQHAIDQLAAEVKELRCELGRLADTQHAQAELFARKLTSKADKEELELARLASSTQRSHLNQQAQDSASSNEYAELALSRDKTEELVKELSANLKRDFDQLEKRMAQLEKSTTTTSSSSSILPWKSSSSSAPADIESRIQSIEQKLSPASEAVNGAIDTRISSIEKKLASLPADDIISRLNGCEKQLMAFQAATPVAAETSGYNSTFGMFGSEGGRQTATGTAMSAQRPVFGGATSAIAQTDGQKKASYGLGRALGIS